MAPRKPPKPPIAQFRKPIRTKGEHIGAPKPDHPERQLLRAGDHGVRIPDPPVPRPAHKVGSLNQHKADVLITFARAGISREGQARAAGIAIETLYEWLRRGRAGEEPYDALAQAMDYEEVTHEADLSQSLLAKGKAGDVAAALGYLERRHPSRWGHKHHLEVKVKGEFEAFFAYMRERISSSAYEEVIRAAASFGAPPAALPPAEVIDVEAVE